MELHHIAISVLQSLDLTIHKKSALLTAHVETKECATKLMELANTVLIHCNSMLKVLVALIQNALMTIKFRKWMN